MNRPVETGATQTCGCSPGRPPELEGVVMPVLCLALDKREGPPFSSGIVRTKSI